ncbi:MAG: 2-oxoacid:acceptor oxidoreductase family protein, partial [Pseudomonadota bacterium]
ETLRALNKCNKNTVIITNVQPLPPFTVSVGQGVYPPVDEILDKVQTRVDRVVALHANDLAEEAGNSLSLNMVMLGALIGTGTVPVNAEVMKETISTSTKKAFLDSNLKAFDLGMEAGKKLAGS